VVVVVVVLLLLLLLLLVSIGIGANVCDVCAVGVHTQIVRTLR
jgi:hypothetical protein